MNALTSLVANLTSLLLIFAWIGGVVIAQGFWSTIFCIVPFWAWYLFVEQVLQLTHFI